jgi:hypothetical protein
MHERFTAPFGFGTSEPFNECESCTGQENSLASPRVVFGKMPSSYDCTVKVFISHAEKDGPYAALLGRALTGAGLSVWEPSAVQPGDNWALKTGEALAKADAVVVLLSPDSVASEWVRREIEFTISSPRFNGRLIPVLVRPTPEVPWILEELPQWVEADNPAAAAKKIVGLLKERKTVARARAREAR